MKEITKEIITSLYIDQKLGIPQIAKLLQIGKTTVHRKLIKYDIPRRSVGETRFGADWTGKCQDCNSKVSNKKLCKSCGDKRYRTKYQKEFQLERKIKRSDPKYRTYMKEYLKEYTKKNIEKIRKIKSKYSKNNEQAIIRARLRERLRQALKQYSLLGKCKSSKKYGINYQSIIDHLGPCPGSKKDYHIDHIKPLCSFDLNDPDQIKIAFAPENHQWLTKEENLRKGTKERRRLF